MRALFADDDPNLHTIVKLWLEKNGHDVECVLNGQLAFERLQQESFDLLISDVNMPAMNGIELVKAVIELPKPPALIIVLTSRCDLVELQKKANSTKIHMFSKPFSPSALAELIDKLSLEIV